MFCGLDLSNSHLFISLSTSNLTGHPMNEARGVRPQSLQAWRSMIKLAPGVEACPGYKLTKPLGQGGFGCVWEAVANDGTKAALKFLDCRGHQSSVVVNEIKLLVTLRDLKHPNVIQFYNIHTGPNTIILSMELADGSVNDLHYIYREDQKTHVPPSVLLSIMQQTAAALDFMSAQRLQTSGFAKTGLQHCDVKPSNLLLVGNVVKVADFGLSGPMQFNVSRNVIIGTPPYAAPELFEGRMTERTDQFGMAVMYCELRAGRFPIPISTDGRYPAALPDFSFLPDRERVVVAKAMQKQWLDRYPNCTEFVEALRRVMDTNPIPYQPSQPASGVRKINPIGGSTPKHGASRPTQMGR